MPDISWVTANESTLRLAVFAGVLGLMAAAEALAPSRPRRETRARRWTANLALSLINSLALRLLLPGAAVLAAIWAQMRGWGIANQLAAPPFLSLALTVLALDLAMGLMRAVEVAETQIAGAKR